MGSSVALRRRQETRLRSSLYILPSQDFVTRRVGDVHDGERGDKACKVKPLSGAQRLPVPKGEHVRIVAVSQQESFQVIAFDKIKVKNYF